MLDQIKATVRPGKPDPKFPDMYDYRVTLRFQGRQFTTPFHKGSRLPEEPTALEVLEILFLDSDVEGHDFESWAWEMGYDWNSREAERTFRALVKQTEKLRKFLGEDFDAVQEEVALATA